jgi:HEAT repeat protein
LVACGLVGFELSEGLGTDVSSEAQIRKLQSYWVYNRRSAATEPARFPNETEKVVPALVKALADPDTDVQIRAMESLKTFGEDSQPAGAVLRELLHQNSDGPIRQHAVSLAGSIKDGDAVPILITALDDRDPLVRLEATRSLGNFGPGIASGPLIDKLVRALGPDNPQDLREASVARLARRGPRAGRPRHCRSRR